jgi:hypothetical protein
VLQRQLDGEEAACFGYIKLRALRLHEEVGTNVALDGRKGLEVTMERNSNLIGAKGGKSEVISLRWSCHEETGKTDANLTLASLPPDKEYKVTPAA